MLRRMTNEELFELYDSDLILRLHNAKNLSDTRKFLTRFKHYLGSYPPSPEIAKSFLAQYANRKPRTLYRYAQMLRMFMKWYGEPMDDLRVIWNDLLITADTPIISYRFYKPGWDNVPKGPFPGIALTG